MNDTPSTAVAITRTAHTEVGMRTFGNGALPVLQSMADVVTIAQLMAKSGVAVPKHLRDNPGGCLAVSLRALSWNADPFAVASKTFSVNDNMGYEAQLMAAVIIAHAPIKGRPKYTFTGDGGKRKCKVEVIDRETGEVLDYESPGIDKITPKNSPLWKSDEDQQHGYYSIRALARRHYPDIILGMYDREEVESFASTGDGAGSGVMARLTSQERPQGTEGSAVGFTAREDAGRPQATASAPTAEAEPDTSASAPPASKASPKAAAASSPPESETQPDDGPLAEGYPSLGQIHYLAGVKAAKDGRRQSFRNGKPHTMLPKGTKGAEFSVTEAQIKAHFAAPVEPESDPEVVEDEVQEPEVEDVQEDVQAAALEAEALEEVVDDPDFPPEFSTYIDAVENTAADWVGVKAAMAEFYKTEYFKGLTPARQNQIRGETWAMSLERQLPGLPDQAGDVSAFRLWIEWIGNDGDPEAADAIVGTLRALEQDEVFAAKDDTFKAAIRKAAADRMNALGA